MILQPYPGITEKTCDVKNVNRKDILLIDDLYTEGVNIDEDAIQTLLDNGATNVFFYSLGKTKKGIVSTKPSVIDDVDDLPF